jgi:hypothetical protein
MTAASLMITKATTTYTALTVSSRTTKVTHLWVGDGNLCGADFTMAPVVRQLQQNTICKKCAADQHLYDAAQAHAEADRQRIANTRNARRLASGQSAVTGWELLYDKPNLNAQVGRRDKSYALICTLHGHAHRLAKLVDERELRAGDRSAWCPGCAENNSDDE